MVLHYQKVAVMRLASKENCFVGGGGAVYDTFCHNYYYGGWGNACSAMLDFAAVTSLHPRFGVIGGKKGGSTRQ